MPVAVFQALKEMDGLATTLMNAGMGLTSVTHTQHVQTQKALMNAAAFLGFVEMVKFVVMSTNVSIDHMTAVRMRLVRTLWAPIDVHAMSVSMAMVAYALTSMSAALEVISVMLMPAVLTSLALTAAPAEKVTPEMDDIVTVSIGSAIQVSLLSCSQYFFM